MIDLEDALVHHSIQKIDILSLDEKIEKIRASDTVIKGDVLRQKQTERDEYKEGFKRQKTKILDFYLKRITRERIEQSITYIIAKDADCCILAKETIKKYGNNEYDWDIDRDLLLDTPLGQIPDIDMNFIIGLDTSKSIMQMLKEIIPDGFRVYNIYGNNRGVSSEYEITIRYKSVLCNDPCCLFLCLYNKVCMYKTDRCCYYCFGYPSCRCCCGP